MYPEIEQAARLAGAAKNDPTAKHFAGLRALQVVSRTGQPLSGDYLHDMIAGGVKRWSSSRFPLRVFIGSGQGVPGYQPGYGQMISDALNQWSQVSKRVVTWQPTNDSSDADIVIDWAQRPADMADGAETGETNLRTMPDGNGGGIIQSARVTILTTMRGINISPIEVRKTCLHEIGHALGLNHSSTNRDIMHWQSSLNQETELSARDGTTLQRLYSLQ